MTQKGVYFCSQHPLRLHTTYHRYDKIRPAIYVVSMNLNGKRNKHNHTSIKPSSVPPVCFTNRMEKLPVSSSAIALLALLMHVEIETSDVRDTIIVCCICFEYVCN